MSRLKTLDPSDKGLLSMPRPVPDWTGQALEYFFLLGTTLWLGVHGSSALLTAPLLTRTAAPSEEMARLIMGGANAIDLADQASKEGIDDLRRSALKKIMQGLISLEEANRVTKD
jgi:hypothetical protein